MLSLQIIELSFSMTHQLVLQLCDGSNDMCKLHDENNNTLTDDMESC